MRLGTDRMCENVEFKITDASPASQIVLALRLLLNNVSILTISLYPELIDNLV